MAVPDPSQVAPWYLRNITQALELDEATGNVFIRTNAAIIGNVSVGNVAIGSLGNVDLSNTYLPVQVEDGNITVYQGDTPWVVSGNVGVTGNVNVTQGTSPWVVSGNVGVSGNVNANVTGGNISVTGTANVSVVDSYEMNVAQGHIVGQSLVTKNGFVTGLSQDVESTIWNDTTLYPWSSWTVAQKLYIISSSASDTGQTLRIVGLDGSHNVITEDVTTNGTTAVATTNNFLRINHAYLIAGNANAGTITQRLTSGVGTVVGSMAIGFSRNKGGFYTVPAGYTAYILYGDATQFRGGSGNIGGVIKMFTRTPNGGTAPFILQFVAEVVNGQYRNDFNVPLAVPEKTDIDVRIVADGNNTQATCNWQMILVAN